MSHILEIFEKTPLTEALYRTYEAKKNAEIAPGVGRGTDMGIIRESSFEELDEVILKKLNDIYEERKEGKPFKAIKDELDELNSLF